MPGSFCLHVFFPCDSNVHKVNSSEASDFMVGVFIRLCIHQINLLTKHFHAPEILCTHQEIHLIAFSLALGNQELLGLVSY